MTSEEKPAIEKQPPITNNRWLPEASEVTIYRLKLLSPQQIVEHGLEKYAAQIGGEDNAQ